MGVLVGMGTGVGEGGMGVPVGSNVFVGIGVFVGAGLLVSNMVKVGRVWGAGVVAGSGLSITMSVEPAQHRIKTATMASKRRFLVMVTTSGPDILTISCVGEAGQ
jgi:hypothetical protein